MDLGEMYLASGGTRVDNEDDEVELVENRRRGIVARERMDASTHWDRGDPAMNMIIGWTRCRTRQCPSESHGNRV
jgi:hypothetical protein